MVRVQRSGGGMAAASPMTVNAGDAMSTIKVTYTADGQVDNGQLKLTIPGTSEDWDAPMMEQRYDHRRRLQYRYGEVWRRSYGSRTCSRLPQPLPMMISISVQWMSSLIMSCWLEVARLPLCIQAQWRRVRQVTLTFAVAIDGGDGPDTEIPMSVEKSMITVTVERGSTRFRYGSGYRYRTGLFSPVLRRIPLPSHTLSPAQLATRRMSASQ